jgi:hypothetical protein
MVVVRTRDDTTDSAVSIMRGHGPVDINASVERWRKDGWARFEETPIPNSPHYTREDLIVPEDYEREHASYIHMYKIIGRIS